MSNPVLTQALAEQRINEMHRRAARRLPTSAPAAHFLGLQALTEGLPRLRRRSRAASKASGPAVRGARATNSAGAGGPVGCVV